MKDKKVLFIFRKPNKGNYSVEKIYRAIFNKLLENNEEWLALSQYSLKYNYDLIAFTKHFLGSLISKKYMVHITGGCNYMILAFPFKTRVLTIHDLFHFNNFKGIKGYLYDMFYIKLPVCFSHKIVAVSEHTKQQLIEKLSVSEDKITVINNPLLIPKEKRKKRKRVFSTKNPLKILQIGDKPLKNYKRLIEATLDRNVHYSFVHANPIKIQKLIKKFSLENCTTVYSNLSEEELYKQYDGNDVLFFASEAEGFGLPIIEAQAFGLPVITSNTPPMNDFKNGTILVNPFSVEDIKKGFTELFKNELLEYNPERFNEEVIKYEIDIVVNLYLNLYKNM